MSSSTSSKLPSTPTESPEKAIVEIIAKVLYDDDRITDATKPLGTYFSWEEISSHRAFIFRERAHHLIDTLRDNGFIVQCQKVPNGQEV